MPEQRFVFGSSFPLGKIVLCVSFVGLAVLLGLISIVLGHKSLGWLAACCYVGACLSVPRQLLEKDPGRESF
jgi:hypothetical protein